MTEESRVVTELRRQFPTDVVEYHSSDEISNYLLLHVKGESAKDYGTIYCAFCNDIDERQVNDRLPEVREAATRNGSNCPLVVSSVWCPHNGFDIIGGVHVVERPLLVAAVRQMRLILLYPDYW